MPDGRLDLGQILREFAAFWGEHGEALASGLNCHEVAPQPVLMAYLQRVVNGGGCIDREYGVGRGRIDLLVRWPYQDPDGQRALQREALERKLWRKGKSDPLTEGLKQLDGNLLRVGLDRGVLVLFDRRDPNVPPVERIRFEQVTSPSGRQGDGPAGLSQEVV